MIINRKFTAILIATPVVNDTVIVELSYGEIEHDGFGGGDAPKEEFDTEDEAIEWAYSHFKDGRWMIVPIVTFDVD